VTPRRTTFRSLICSAGIDQRERLARRDWYAGPQVRRLGERAQYGNKVGIPITMWRFSGVSEEALQVSQAPRSGNPEEFLW
jgi:hypothetical protein